LSEILSTEFGKSIVFGKSTESVKVPIKYRIGKSTDFRTFTGTGTCTETGTYTNSVPIPVPVIAGTGISTDTEIPVKNLALQNTDTKIPVSRWPLIPIPECVSDSEFGNRNSVPF
jgi:hypothetical protein